MHVSMCVCVYVCRYTCTYVSMYIHMFISMYVCMYTCMYVSMYIHMYVRGCFGAILICKLRNCIIFDILKTHFRQLLERAHAPSLFGM